MLQMLPERSVCRSRHGRGTASIVSLVSLVIVTVTTAHASASTRVDVRRLRLSVHGADALSVRTSAIGEAGWSFGAFVGYARDPLQLLDTSKQAAAHRIVGHHTTVDLLVARRFGRRLSIGVHLPVVPFATGGAPMAGLPTADGLGLADPAVSAKWQLRDRAGGGVGLALEPVVTFPLASAGSYAGDGGLTFAPRLIADAAFGGTTVAINLGIRARPGADIGPYRTGSEANASVMVRHDLAGGDAMLLAELGFAGRLTDPLQGNGRSLEAQVGGGVCIGRRAMLTVAAGGGALSGLGSTSLRATAGVRFGPCGAQPVAPAPVVPVPAPVVPAPVVPAPLPVAPRPKPKPADRDGDGVLDPDDACPDVPGLPSKVPARNGCPPPKVVKKRIVIAQRIEFETDSDVIRTKWLPVLNDVAALIQAHPELRLLEVQGHTDDRHTAAYNLALSSRRAAAVVRYLRRRGVAAKRLQSRGFGLTRPLTSNATAVGRARNRRVEFHVMNVQTAKDTEVSR